MIRNEENPTPSEEHVEFMKKIQQAISALIGEDKMVAMLGDEEYGIYCVMFAVVPNASSFVMAHVGAMISNKLAEMIHDYVQKAKLERMPAVGTKPS
jgi:hypothetical protein